MHTDIATIAARRNDDLLRFADAVTAYMAAPDATIDALRTVVNSTVKSTDTTIEEPTMAAPTIARWQDQPASKSQQRYIPALAARKGMHTVKNAKTGEMMPITAENVATMTKGYASKLYYALKGLSIVSQHTDSAIDWDTDGRDDNGYADSDSTSRWIERTERMYV